MAWWGRFFGADAADVAEPVESVSLFVPVTLHATAHEAATGERGREVLLNVSAVESVQPIRPGLVCLRLVSGGEWFAAASAGDFIGGGE